VTGGAGVTAELGGFAAAGGGSAAAGLRTGGGAAAAPPVLGAVDGNSIVDGGSVCAWVMLLSTAGGRCNTVK